MLTRVGFPREGREVEDGRSAERREGRVVGSLRCLVSARRERGGVKGG